MVVTDGERQQEDSERSQLLASRWQDSCCRVRVQNPERFQPLWGGNKGPRGEQ